MAQLVTLNKQLLDEVFVICRIISVEVRVISRVEGEADSSTETLIIWHITKPNLYVSSGKTYKLNPIIVLLNMACETIEYI